MTNIIICLIVSVLISIPQMLGRFLDVRSNGLNISIIRIGIEELVFSFFVIPPLFFCERLTTYVSETGLYNYRPLITDGVKQYFNNEYLATNKADFIKVYVELGKDYPGPYVSAVIYLTKGDWHIMDTTFCEVYKDWWRDRTGYLITDATKVFAGDFVKKSNLWPGVRNLYEGFATDCSFTKFIPAQVICSPAFYVFLSFLGAFALMIN